VVIYSGGAYVACGGRVKTVVDFRRANGLSGGPMRSAVLVLVLMLPLALAALGCGGARPYRAMAKAATSEESVFTQAQDKRCAMHIR
jgi:hypothetical protein